MWDIFTILIYGKIWESMVNKGFVGCVWMFFKLSDYATSDFELYKQLANQHKKHTQITQFLPNSHTIYPQSL